MLSSEQYRMYTLHCICLGLCIFSVVALCRFWPVRSYPWGRCEALSSINSDLALLKRLLFEEGFAKLKQDTEERYYK